MRVTVTQRRTRTILIAYRNRGRHERAGRAGLVLGRNEFKRLIYPHGPQCNETASPCAVLVGSDGEHVGRVHREDEECQSVLTETPVRVLNVG